MRRLLLALLTAAIAASAAAAANAPNPQIFSAHLDGGDEQSLSGGEQSAASPTPARDGRIAFVRRTGDRPTYWVMNADGSEQRELAPAPDEEYFGPPAWSPSGRAIAHSRWEYSECRPDSRNCAGSEIVVIDATTGAVRWVVRSRYRGAGSFSWSPEGSRLAYAGELNADLQALTLETVRSDGSGRRVVLRLPRSVSLGYSQVAWSPRGDRIAFVRGGWIELVRPQGGVTTRLVRGHTPVWSPRGDRLLFLSSRQDAVSVIDTATRRVRTLARAPEVSVPAWSPDGRRVALEVRSRGVSTIAVVRVSDGRRLYSWQPGGDVSSPVFSRDGGRLVYSRLAG